MAKKTATSGMAAKLGDRLTNAWEAHKNDETVYSGGGELPDGIEHGIAELRSCKFGIYKEGDKKGEYFFMAAGVVLEPKVHNGIPVEGLRTQIGPEPICDTPKANGKRKTLSDHISWVRNELSKLGVDAASVAGNDLENVAALLEQAKPCFRFRTWKGKPSPQFPNPRTNHTWNGLVDYTAAPTDDVEDNSGQEEAGEEAGEAEDLAALGSLADADDGDAQRRLTELAKAAGIDPEKIATWSEVASMLEAGGGEEAGPAEDRPAPKEGEVYSFTPKGASKAVDGTVTAVFEGSQTVNMKDLSDGKVHRGIAWAGLK